MSPITSLDAALQRIKDLEEQLAKYLAPKPSQPAPAQPKPTSQSGDALSLSMPVYKLSELSAEQRKSLLQRPVMNTAQIMSRVTPIIQQVQSQGDAAVRELTAKFDGVQLDSVFLKPPFKYEIDEETTKAIDVAYENIRKFHAEQIKGEGEVHVETMPVRT